MNPDPELQQQRDELDGQPRWFLVLVFLGWLLAACCYWWPRDLIRRLKT